MGSDIPFLEILMQPSAVVYVYNQNNKNTFNLFKDDNWIQNIHKRYPDVIEVIAANNYNENKEEGLLNEVKKVNPEDLESLIKKNGAVFYEVDTENVSTLEDLFIGIILGVVGDKEDNKGKDGKGCNCCMIY